MPMYRYGCIACGNEHVELLGMESTNPVCCGRLTTKLMPRKVAGWVAGVSVPGKTIVDAPTPRSLAAVKNDPLDPSVVAPSSWGNRDYRECSASEKDDRWRDTTEAMTAWQVRKFESAGMAAHDARVQASAEQQKVTENSRADTEAKSL